MKIYIAMLFDRHIDPIAQVHRTKEGAIKAAKKFVEKNARHPDMIEEEEIQGWEYYCSFSEEGGDSVWVVEGELYE